MLAHESEGGDQSPLSPLIRLRVPVVQAPLGSCDGPDLAAAVSQAGALGCMTVSAPPLPEFQSNLDRIRAVTDQPVLLAFTAQWEPDEVLELALTNGFDTFHIFWWNGPRHASRVRSAGGTVFWQVGSVRQAHDALEMGAHVLIVQGTEAGGPVRTPRSLRYLVDSLRKEFGASVPMVAGGGLADAADVREILQAGADAALLGTRFLLTEEANAPLILKQRLIAARAEDLMLDIDMQLREAWPCAPIRRLAGGEYNSALFAGLGVGRIHALGPAAEIVRGLDPESVSTE